MYFRTYVICVSMNVGIHGSVYICMIIHMYLSLLDLMKEAQSLGPAYGQEASILRRSQYIFLSFGEGCPLCEKAQVQILVGEKNEGNIIFSNHAIRQVLSP